jgi:hypothetical protein
VEAGIAAELRLAGKRLRQLNELFADPSQDPVEKTVEIRNLTEQTANPTLTPFSMDLS